ncbi:ent-copalyl diphosphate synthase 2-like isoform X2 [Panicum miliaceum]|uniref:Ent-copalyl diphosphate synthase 2-like isoform X2 n=1 Tax=Panicum miliaceum TaxID=4540 RepID=A0A3L6RT55_PANMI|nr:ent-copalyl diphosphate synthase 2-like isoform X2 [Panicum miliaceum]
MLAFARQQLNKGVSASRSYGPNGGVVGEPRNVLEMADAIRATLRSMGNGEISVSPYDTAWVALVKKVDNGGEGPQFPSCIDWIAQNQLPDGSWSDDAFFLVQDRIINTLACTIALKSWNVHHDKCNKGLSLIHENMSRLPEDDEDWMLAGFETIFPTLLEMAKI